LRCHTFKSAIDNGSALERRRGLLDANLGGVCGERHVDELETGKSYAAMMLYGYALDARKCSQELKLRVLCEERRFMVRRYR
jgi:hypothetical protein